jgi:hypothetical protein
LVRFYAEEMPGRRIFYQGDEFLSSSLAASVLEVSVRTLKRYEKAGMLGRADIPRGLKGQSWFKRGDVEELAARRATGELRADFSPGEHESRMPFSSFARPGPRSVRSDDDWVSPAEERDGVSDLFGADSSPAPKAVEPVLCPACGGELEWQQDPIRGANAAFGTSAWCGRCGRRADLSEPEEPDDNACRCGQEVTWESRDDGEPGWQGRCAAHGLVAFSDGKGVVAGHQKKRVEEPFRQMGVFPPRPLDTGRARPRGLTESDVVYATRKAPPRPKPSSPTWLPPYELRG